VGLGQLTRELGQEIGAVSGLVSIVIPGGSSFSFTCIEVEERSDSDSQPDDPRVEKSDRM
jgi:hypothetical protein